MRKKAVGWPIVLCLLGGCLCIAMWNDDDAHGWQPPAEPADNGAPANAEIPSKFAGALSCSQCHFQPLFLRDRTNFVGLTEFSTWLTEDKHSRSLLRIIPDEDLFTAKNNEFAQLLKVAGLEADKWGASNKRSAEMCKKLNIDPKDFMNARQCLSCHANWRTQDKEPDVDVQRYGVGVGCESCHGGAKDWLTPHQDSNVWRAKSPKEKFADFGMVDVRSPASRAKQCYGCHVGNPHEGKVVTHEMFAAGHPPLPGIEIETFAKQMPRHWRYLEEKPDFPNRAQFEAAHTTWKKGDLSSSKAVLLGGVAAQRDFLNLLTAQAGDAKQIWPQFSMYDCAACHHDLAKDSVRQAVGYGDRRPGRPWVHRWPQALVNAAITHVGADQSAYDAAMDGLTKVLNDSPFGDRAALAGENNVATQASDWLTTNLIAKVEQAPFDEAAAKKVLLQLCGSGLQDIVDYHSGRQVVWAIKILYNDIASTLPEAKETFETTLKELDDLLELDLPSKAGGDVTGNLDVFLDHMESYDPRIVHEKLKTLATALGS